MTSHDIIRQAKEELPNLAAVNYNMYFGSPAKRADTGKDWTFKQAKKEIESFLSSSLSLAYEQGHDTTIMEVKEICEWMKRECPNHNPEERVGCYGYDENYNSALTDLLELLEAKNKKV